MKRKIALMLALVISVCFIFTACDKPEDNAYQNKTNKYVPHEPVNNIEEGIVWPDGQFFPTFAAPEEELDTIGMEHFKPEEQVTVSSLQGLVNKTKPRLYLLDAGSDEGPTTWSKTSTMNFKPKTYKKSQKFELVKKYINEAKGVVLYDIKQSKHYRNLATTIAGIKDLVPMTQAIYNDYVKEGIELEIVEDITSLTYKTPLEIYGYMYDNYWKDCNNRLLISQDPDKYTYHLRDIVTSLDCAMVYLDCVNDEEKALFEKFLADMQPGNGGVMGWFTTERSGITTVTKYGLSTVPANYFMSATVYAGTDHAIQINEIPNKPELENKLYVALYVSDGDNIQYNQRYMRKLWDSSKTSRGKVPINWTMSPALVDVAPAILNYFYTTATEQDCFVVGPSGLGYTMPINTLNEPGAPTGVNFIEDEEKMATFVKFTETYLQRSGLRVVTVWDTLNSKHREIYEANAPYLYGLTVHDWHGSPAVSPSSVENDRLLVQQIFPCYAGNKGEIVSAVEKKMISWRGEKPEFLACQVTVWGDVKPQNIIEIQKEIEKKYPGKVEFVRADHYYALYNEANGLPFDLSMSDKVSVTATSNNDTAAEILDGTPSGENIWVASETGEQTITLDLGGTYNISRYVIRHAGENGLDASLNTKDYLVEVSVDGENWTTVDDYRGNTVNVTDIDIEKTEAAHLRIVIKDAGADGIARIADVEVYGSK